MSKESEFFYLMGAHKKMKTIKKFAIKLFGFTLFVLFSSLPRVLYAEQGRVVLILDGSNSMWGRIEGKEKIVVAREVLDDVLSKLPEDMNVGLAAYGHRDKKACDDIELLLPPGKYSREKLITTINNVQPKGMTPITAALKLVAEKLSKSNAPTSLVLVSDGKETCDGDPCALVSELREKGIALTVHVVGFDVTKEQSTQLKCIADAGGGKYASAKTAAELGEALVDIREKVVEEIQAEAVPQNPNHWKIKVGDNTYKGILSYIRDGEDSAILQLVSRDAVNVAMTFSGELEGTRLVSDAFFAAGREEECRLVRSKTPFEIKFKESERDRTVGSFSGMFACQNSLPVEVSGSFNMPKYGTLP